MTIREIAAQCGVSRATVDRVINGRGKVHPETEARILHMLQAVGYTKNIAGRALTVRKTAPVIGVVLVSEGNPFFDEVISGMRHAEAALSDYGVTVRIITMGSFSPEAQAECMAALEGEISALVLHPINAGRIVEKVSALAARGIPTVTVNADLPGSERRCYVGSDYAQGGRVAAGMVRLATGAAARMGILSGVETIWGHGQRLEGFVETLRKTAPGISILSIRSAQDDIRRAYVETAEMLRGHPEMDALMVIAAGLEGACEAIRESGRTQSMRVFAFDMIPAARRYMEQGLVRAVISQQPFEQGAQAIRAAFEMLLSGSAETEKRLMLHHIKIPENMDEPHKK